MPCETPSLPACGTSLHIGPQTAGFSGQGWQSYPNPFKGMSTRILTCLVPDRSRNQIGSALGLRWPATWTGGTVTQSLREDAANAYVRLNSAFGKNALWHPGPKSFASEGLLKEFAARRDELQHWNLSWECQETTDDLIGKSSLFNSKHLKIMGYRLGAAPDVNGEIAQVAQALVRYNTTQVS